MVRLAKMTASMDNAFYENHNDETGFSVRHRLGRVMRHGRA
jgi:hypothetical protein